MSRRTRAIAGIGLVAILAALVPLGAAIAGGPTTHGPFVLDGEQEVPGLGDANGSGFAQITLDEYGMPPHFRRVAQAGAIACREHT